MKKNFDLSEKELLIRIDERQQSMEIRLEKIEKNLVAYNEHSYLMTTVKSHSEKLDEIDTWRAGIKGYLSGVLMVTSTLGGGLVYLISLFLNKYFN